MATSDRSRQRRRTTSLVIAVIGLLVAVAWLISAIMESGQSHSPNSLGGTLVVPGEGGLDPWMPAFGVDNYWDRRVCCRDGCGAA